MVCLKCPNFTMVNRRLPRRNRRRLRILKQLRSAACRGPNDPPRTFLCCEKHKRKPNDNNDNNDVDIRIQPDQIDDTNKVQKF